MQAELQSKMVLLLFILARSSSRLWSLKPFNKSYLKRVIKYKNSHQRHNGTLTSIKKIVLPISFQSQEVCSHILGLSAIFFFVQQSWFLKRAPVSLFVPQLPLVIIFQFVHFDDPFVPCHSDFCLNISEPYEFQWTLFELFDRAHFSIWAPIVDNIFLKWASVNIFELQWALIWASLDTILLANSWNSF